MIQRNQKQDLTVNNPRMMLVGKLGILAAGVAAIAVGWMSPKTEPGDAKVQVLMFLDTECPVAQAYAPRIKRLVDEQSPHGVSFTALFPNQGENDGKIRTYFDSNGYTFSWSYDAGAARAKSFGLKMVPAFVVLDGKGKAIVNSKRPSDRVKGGENIGHPAAPEEIAHFMSVLKTTSKMNADELAKIEAWLKNQK